MHPRMTEMHNNSAVGILVATLREQKKNLIQWKSAGKYNSENFVSKQYACIETTLIAEQSDVVSRTIRHQTILLFQVATKT